VKKGGAAGVLGKKKMKRKEGTMYRLLRGKKNRTRAVLASSRARNDRWGGNRKKGEIAPASATR